MQKDKPIAVQGQHRVWMIHPIGKGPITEAKQVYITSIPIASADNPAADYLGSYGLSGIQAQEHVKQAEAEDDGEHAFWDEIPNNVILEEAEYYISQVQGDPELQALIEGSGRSLYFIELDTRKGLAQALSLLEHADEDEYSEEWMDHQVDIAVNILASRDNLYEQYIMKGQTS